MNALRKGAPAVSTSLPNYAERKCSIEDVTGRVNVRKEKQLNQIQKCITDDERQAPAQQGEVIGLIYDTFDLVTPHAAGQRRSSRKKKMIDPIGKRAIRSFQGNEKLDRGCCGGTNHPYLRTKWNQPVL